MLPLALSMCSSSRQGLRRSHKGWNVRSNGNCCAGDPTGERSPTASVLSACCHIEGHSDTRHAFLQVNRLANEWARGELNPFAPSP